MQRFSSAGAVLLLLLGASVATAGSGGAIKIPRNVPYSSEASVADNVRQQCWDLGTRLGTSLQRYSAKYGVGTVVVDEVGPTVPGRVFQLEITNVFSAGNAFIGHRKSMAARGELFVDGVSKGKVNFTRNSGGGFGAGFKGSCSVLARCSKTLGNDFAKWLRKNANNYETEDGASRRGAEERLRRLRELREEMEEIRRNQRNDEQRRELEVEIENPDEMQ